MTDQEIKQHIRERYGKHALKAQNQTVSCCGSETQSCCGPQAQSCCGGYTQQIGYSLEEVANLPESTVNAAAGCGNPHAIAGLREGEALLDLGSGGGIDVFIAAQKVGSTGRAVGVDMTDEMLELARKNAEELGLTNVEFRKGDIEALPFEDSEFDVIISNCVINLAPDKDKVFNDAYRVLKPGGRLVVSDIVTKDELPEEIRKDMDGWASCVSGAIPLEKYLGKLKDAGFQEVHVVSKRGSELILSAEIEAHKPL
jgi:arsenite methyltransferase